MVPGLSITIMIKLPVHGIFTALWTPADACGRIETIALARHLEFLKTTRLAGLLAWGSTGEFVHFSETERIAFIERIVPLASPLPVLANVSDVNPAVAGRLAYAARAAGCAGIALLPPWFFALSDEDQLAFFLQVAGATDLPVVLYNFPERTGNRIALETISAFADRAPLAGVKQSGGDWEFHHELVALGRAKNFSVFTGQDTRLEEALALGCTGAISGLANFVPELLVNVFTAFQQGRTGTPEWQLLQRVGAAGGALPFPLNVAAGMKARGFATGTFKQVVSEPTRLQLDRVVATLIPLLREGGLAG